MHTIDGGFIIIVLTLLSAAGLLYAWYASEHVSESVGDISDLITSITPTRTPFMDVALTAREFTDEEITEFQRAWNEAYASRRQAVILEAEQLRTSIEDAALRVAALQLDATLPLPTYYEGDSGDEDAKVR